MHEIIDRADKIDLSSHLQYCFIREAYFTFFIKKNGTLLVA